MTNLFCPINEAHRTPRFNPNSCAKTVSTGSLFLLHSDILCTPDGCILQWHGRPQCHRCPKTDWGGWEGQFTDGSTPASLAIPSKLE